MRNAKACWCPSRVLEIIKEWPNKRGGASPHDTDSDALAGSRSTICHADSHAHRGPGDAATGGRDNARQPAAQLAGARRRPRRCGRRRWEGRGLPRPELRLRPQSLGSRRAGVGGLQPSPCGRPRLCWPVRSFPPVMERWPFPAPPEHLGHRPGLRAFWNAAAHDGGCRAPGGSGREPSGEGGTCEVRAARPGPPVCSRREVAAGESRLARAGGSPCRGTKAGYVTRSARRPRWPRRDFGSRFPPRVCL